MRPSTSARAYVVAILPIAWLIQATQYLGIVSLGQPQETLRGWPGETNLGRHAKTPVLIVHYYDS